MALILVDESALDGNESSAGIIGSRPLLDSETAGGQLEVFDIEFQNADVEFVLVDPAFGFYGILTLQEDGLFSYTLAFPFDSSGSPVMGRQTVLDAETFAYEVYAFDGESSFLLEEGSIIVDIIDDVPVAMFDTANASAGGSVDGNVLDNDVFGADGPPILSAGVVGARLANGDLTTPVISQQGLPAVVPGNYGTLIIAGDGSYTYTAVGTVPAGQFQDVFVYSIADSEGDLSTAALTVNVEGTFEARDDAVTALEDTPATYETSLLLANDDSGFIASVSNPLNGSVSLDPVTNTIVFIPAPDFNGIASFDYELQGPQQTDSATVTITVQPVNDPPIAVDDAFGGIEDLPLIIPASELLANDSDIDGDPLVVTGISGAVNGTATLLNGSVTFTPNADFNGIASFDYTVSDGNEGTDTASVTIDFSPLNDPPVLGGGRLVILVFQEDREIVIDASDPDDDPLDLTVDQPDGGTVTVTGEDTLTFTPDDGFIGISSFRFRISDGTDPVEGVVETVVTARPEIDTPSVGLALSILPITDGVTPG